MKKIILLLFMLFGQAKAQVVLRGNYIKVIGRGGTPPYKYNINGGRWQTNDTFKNLRSGTYSVGTLDSKGCSRSTRVSLINK